MSAKRGGSAARSTSAARRSAAAFLNHARLSLTRAGSCRIELLALSFDGTGKGRRHSQPLLEVAFDPNDHVGCGPGSPEHSIRETAPPPFGRRIVRNDEKQIVIAVGSG